MIFRPLRTKLYRLAVKGRRLLLLQVDETHRGVGIAEARIELNGPSSELRGFGARSIDRKAPVGRRVVRSKHQDLCQLGVSRSIARIEANSLAQQPVGLR